MDVGNVEEETAAATASLTNLMEQLGTFSLRNVCEISRRTGEEGNEGVAPFHETTGT